MTDVPVVYIKWLDHASLDSVNWQEPEEVIGMADGVEVHTVGYLLHETEKTYRVVMTIEENGKVAQNINILKAAVLEFKELVV